MAFKRKQVTFPTLKLTDDQEVLIRFNSEIYQGKPIKMNGQTQEKPADLARVTHFNEDGEPLGDYEMVVGTVLKSVLDETYEGEYVGKAFAVTRHAKQEGKSYKQYSVFELDFDE